MNAVDVYSSRRYFVTPMTDRIQDQLKTRANSLSRDPVRAKEQIREMRALLKAYEQELKKK